MKERDNLHSIAWKSICEESQGRSMTMKEVEQIRKQNNYWKCIKVNKECHEERYGGSYCCWDCEVHHRKGESIKGDVHFMCCWSGNLP